MTVRVRGMKVQAILLQQDTSHREAGSVDDPTTVPMVLTIPSTYARLPIWHAPVILMDC